MFIYYAYVRAYMIYDTYVKICLYCIAAGVYRANPSWKWDKSKDKQCQSLTYFHFDSETSEKWSNLTRIVHSWVVQTPALHLCFYCFSMCFCVVFFAASSKKLVKIEPLDHDQNLWPYGLAGMNLETLGGGSFKLLSLKLTASSPLRFSASWKFQDDPYLPFGGIPNFFRRYGATLVWFREGKIPIFGRMKTLHTYGNCRWISLISSHDMV